MRWPRHKLSCCATKKYIFTFKKMEMKQVMTFQIGKVLVWSGNTNRNSWTQKSIRRRKDTTTSNYQLLIWEEWIHQTWRLATANKRALKQWNTVTLSISVQRCEMHTSCTRKITLNTEHCWRNTEWKETNFTLQPLGPAQSAPWAGDQLSKLLGCMKGLCYIQLDRQWTSKVTYYTAELWQMISWTIHVWPKISDYR